MFIIENFSFQGGKGRFLHCQSCRLVFGSCYRLVEMVEAGRNLWMSSYANPQPIYNQLPMSHWILTISKCEESTAPMGNLFQCLVTGFVQSKEKKKFQCFLTFNGHFQCFSLCPGPLVLALGTTGKNLGPSTLFAPSLQVFI